MVVISAPATRDTGVAAGARRRAVHVHRARAALADAAAELRSLEIEHVAQHPEQRHIGRDIHRRGFSVDLERERHVLSAPGRDSTGSDSIEFLSHDLPVLQPRNSMESDPVELTSQNFNGV